MELVLKKIVNTEMANGFVKKLILEADKNQEYKINVNISGEDNVIAEWQSQHGLIQINDTINIEFIQKQKKL